MVRFIHLKIRNANPFKTVDLNFERKGLVRIVGRNGAGKSSLWHLMTFLYYGLNPTKATKSTIQMDTKDFLIEGSFMKEDTRYWCATAVKSKEKNPLGEPYGTGYFLFKKTPEGAWENISWHKAADTQKLVKDLLGWSLEEWHGYVYLAQQTSHMLINGTPSERQKYLSALFNLEPLDVIAEHYKARALVEYDKVIEIQKKQDQIVLLENMLTVERFRGTDAADIERVIEETKIKVEDLNFVIGELEAEHSRYDELNGLREIMEQAEYILIGDGSEQEQKVLAEIETLQTESAEYRAVSGQRAQLKTKIDRHGIRLGQLMVSMGVTSMPDDFDQVMASPDISLDGEKQRLAGLRDLEKKIRTDLVQPAPIPEDNETVIGWTEIDLAKTEAEIQKIRNRPAPPQFERPPEEDLDMLRMDISNAQSNQKLLREKQEQLAIEGTCPTCGSELNQSHRMQQQADVDQALHAYEEDLKLIPQMLRDLTKKRDAWIEYDKLGPDRSSEIPELEEAVRRQKIKQEYRLLVNQNNIWLENELNKERTKQIPEIAESIRLYEKKTSYRQLQDRIKEQEMLEAQRDEMNLDLKEIDLKLAGLRDRTAEVQTLKGQLENLKELIGIKRKIDVLMASNPADQSDAITVHKLNHQDLQKKLGEAEAHLTELKDIIERIQALTSEVSGAEATVREQKKCEILAKEYGKAGKIRQKQLSKFTGYLKDALTCHTFQQLPEHQLSFDVDNGIAINTSKNGCRAYDVCTMSGGEKGALSGALLFALDDMLPPDRKTSLKIVDELESAFDPENKQGFFDYMLPELRNRAETVIVISHTPVDDPSLFDRTWEVKDGKVTDISGEVREAI